MTYGIEVPPSGSKYSEIVLVGEAPAKNEVFEGRVFCGSTGDWLDRILHLSFLPRNELYITNISKVRAPKDKLSKMPQDELDEWIDKLIDEINSLHNVKVIVPLGAYALEAITGITGITKRRGTPMRPKAEIKHDCIVIPTFHPSNIHYNYRSWPLMVADLSRVRILKEKNFEFEFPQFNFFIEPTYETVMEKLQMFEDNPPTFATIDVENPRGLLSAIGIAWSRFDAISIPFYMGNGDNYWTLEQEIGIWRRLSEVLPKMNLGNQNVMYDWRVMKEHGIPLKPAIWDPMLMHHCLYSELSHKLDVITSIYTDLPYYKTDEKEEKGSSIRSGREREHWEYNCYDCVGALWAVEELKEELIEEKMLDVYIKFYAEMIEPMLKMNINGTPVDESRLKDVEIELKNLIASHCEAIKNETGYDVFISPPGVKSPPKNKLGEKININSPNQVADLLYEKLKMARYSKGSTGAEIMERLSYKYKTEVPNMIVEAKSARKQIGLFTPENVINGRIYCQYSLSRTKTGRFASRKGFDRSGMNLQNVKKGAQRKFFIAESGQIMLGADQEGAEAFAVSIFARDKAMQALFATGESIHRQNAFNIFGEWVEKDTPMYFSAKRLVHGGNYGLGPMQFARMLKIPFAEAKEHLENYHATYPGIRNTFQSEVRRDIRESRTLYNPFGRRQVFFGEMNDKTFREGYAFRPQSTVSDINKSAVKFMSKYYTVLLEGHDGILISVPPKERKNAIDAMQEAYDTPFEFDGIMHRIPIEITEGANWDEQKPIPKEDY